MLETDFEQFIEVFSIVHEFCLVLFVHTFIDYRVSSFPLTKRSVEVKCM